jgi:hypothetical protein
MGEDKICRCEEKHHGHMCMLKCKGLTYEIEQATRKPNVICLNCEQEANSEDYVCLPVSLYIWSHSIKGRA